MVYSTKLKLVENVSLEKNKRKRWNKNTKKAHRKKIDLSDVEKNLEQQRREERHGGLIKDRKSDDLLFLDTDGTGGESTIEDLPLGADPHAAEPKELVGFKPMRRKLSKKPLKCHNLLNGLPGVKDPLKKRNRVRTIEERRDPIVRKKLEAIENGPKGEQKRKMVTQQRQSEINRKKMRPTSNRIKNFAFNLWDDKDDSDDEVIGSYTKLIKEHYRRQTKTAPIKPPKGINNATSALPAINLPDPGSSYNPSFEDHQILLKRAFRQEEKRLNNIEKIEKKTTQMFPTIDKAPNTMTWLVEMSEGLASQNTEEGEEESDMEDQDGEKEDITVTGHAIKQRKTKQQRRKELAMKVATVAKETKKLKKVRETNVFRVKSLMKELNTNDKLNEVKREKRLKREALKKYQPKRLCKTRFQEDDIAVCLGDDLCDSLRTVKPQVNVMEEHFRSLQRRNKIESRVKAKMVRKYKVRKQVKRGHRVDYSDLRKTSV